MMGRYQLGAAVGGLIGVAFAGVLVDAYGWRAAFWMWIPLGILVTIAVLRLPEPDRGAQDRAFHLDGLVDSAPAIVPDLALPGEVRVGSLHYASASWGEVIRELAKIRSMWFGVMSLTISSFLLGALGAWGSSSSSVAMTCRRRRRARSHL